MTLLASWAAIDSRNPSAVYIVSDSRISWGKRAKFDFGKKVFGCNNSPDIFGYCGDVLFPSIVLNQITDLIDQGLLYGENWDCIQKTEAVTKKLIESFKNYPTEVKDITTNSLQVIHCSRDNEQNFHCSKIEWRKEANEWKGTTVELKDFSDKLFVIGSGAKEFKIKYEDHWKSVNTKTSRAIYHCFNDTLENIEDSQCGGAPQLVGLYRIENAKHYGIIYNGNRYFQGIKINNLKKFNNIEWRNELFEICDGNTMKIKSNAQRQPNPLRD